MWIGACTSSVGTWMQKLAQSWLVFQLSGSAFMLGLDSFLGEIPIFLFSLVGGVAADRIDRRRLLIISQLIQMTCAFVLATLFAFQVVQVWHILALSFVVGTAQSFGGPAYQALIPTLVPREHLPNAIAMNSIQFNLARIIGPVLGGLALAKLGATWCFAFNGISYVAVIITLILIHTRHVPAQTKETIWTSMKQGIAFIRKQTAMESLILVAFMMTMLGIPMIVFLPVFAKEVFHGNEGLYTALLVIEAAGAILGAIYVAGKSKRANLGKQAVITITGLGLFMAAFALTPVLPLSMLFLFIAGSMLIASFAFISSLVQLVATDEMRGRVMSVYNVAFRGGMPIGALMTGYFIKDLGAPVMIGLNGALLVIMGVYLLVLHRKVAAL